MKLTLRIASREEGVPLLGGVGPVVGLCERRREPRPVLIKHDVQVGILTELDDTIERQDVLTGLLDELSQEREDGRREKVEDKVELG